MRKIAAVIIVISFLAGCGPLNYYVSPKPGEVTRIAVLPFGESSGNTKKAGEWL